jgi:hypothetical protein
MSEVTPEDDIYSLQAKITSQASLVRQLKKDGAAAAQINEEVKHPSGDGKRRPSRLNETD